MTAFRVQYVPLSELDLEQAAARWLSPLERQAWQAMHAPERRTTWLAGRVVAKQMLSWIDPRPSAVHIETRSQRAGHGERPQVFVASRAVPCAVSIAHTSRGVLVAVSHEPGVQLGVDLVDTAPQREHLNWALTADERAWLSAARPARDAVARLWAMKEALYKACQQGEGFAPGQIDVTPGRAPRYPNSDFHATLRGLQHWRVDGHSAALAVVIANTECSPATLLSRAA